jgi:membrane-associated protease RseP (regulator of RpoE activity)
MNIQNLGTTLCAGALGVTLIALPGASAGRQEPSQESTKELRASEAHLESRAKKLAAETARDVQKIRSGGLLDDEDISISDDGDVHVLMGSNGGWLGIGVGEVNPNKVKELKLPAERGVLVGKVVSDSPAAKAGLKENDVVTEINGQRVEGTEQFRRMIREIPPGRIVQLTVWRDGRAQTIGVTVGKSENHRSMSRVFSTPGNFAFKLPDVQVLPEIPEISDSDNFAFSFSARPRLGIDSETLDGDFGNYFGVPEGQGVLVRSVIADSPAAKAGLKTGDVITSVNGDRIRSVAELRQKVATKGESNSVKLGVIRNKTEISVMVELPAPPKPEMHRLSDHAQI